MNLKHLNTDDLISELKDIGAAQRDLFTRELHYIMEVERRQAHLSRGHSSLYVFCQRELGYSNYEATIRIQAMRLLKDFPEMEEKMDGGELNLTVAAQAQSTFQRVNRKRRQSKQKILTSEEKESVLSDLLGASTREAERKLASVFPEAPKPERAKAISEDLTRIEFTASRELMAKLEKLKHRLAHKNFEGRYDVLIEILADIALEKIDAPVRRAPYVSARHEGSPAADLPKRRTRYIRKHVKRQIWAEEYEQGCAYVDPASGRRCGEKHGLQTDHIEEFSLGGSNDRQNLRLYCGAHNRLRIKIATCIEDTIDFDFATGREFHLKRIEERIEREWQEMRKNVL